MKYETKIILEKTFIDHPDLIQCQSNLILAWEILIKSYKNNGKLLLCGNGGSAADCEHIVGELMKGFVLKRPIPEDYKQKIKNKYPENAQHLIDNLQGALPAISLVSHVALNSAFSNDVSADMCFAQQVYGYGDTGDVLIALSTSGRSINVCNAGQVANVKGMKTIAIIGSVGGYLASLSDCVIKLPSTETYKIQEETLVLYHCLCAMLEREMFDS